MAGLAPTRPKDVTHRKRLPGKVLIGTYPVKEADPEAQRLVAAEAEVGAQVLDARVVEVVTVGAAVIKRVVAEDAPTLEGRRRKKNWMLRWRTTLVAVVMLRPRPMVRLLLLRPLGMTRPPPQRSTTLI